MNKKTFSIVSIVVLQMSMLAIICESSDIMLNKLNPEEERIINHKGTEPPFSGKYNNFFKNGIYKCKRCNTPLFLSSDKFKSGCGWPAFDDEISGTVEKIKESDGIRTETLCVTCGAHLGHLFTGEHLTEKNIRHCVNSISLKFEPLKKNFETDTAYFAGGCFWGVEYWFGKEEGIISAESGYMGGHIANPSYKEVCDGRSGHYETVRIIFNKYKTSYEKLAKLFFEIHDPEQKNGQGPDIGNQYKSVIFYTSEEHRRIIKNLIDYLSEREMKIATMLIPANMHRFYVAEEFHQKYYKKNSKMPYCHIYRKLF